MPNVLTIRDAVDRAKADGLPVTEYALRKWIKSGDIPVRKVGNKCLLFYPNLESYLKCEDGADNSPAPVAAAGGVCRVDAWGNCR